MLQLLLHTADGGLGLYCKIHYFFIFFKKFFGHFHHFYEHFEGFCLAILLRKMYTSKIVTAQKKLLKECVPVGLPNTLREGEKEEDWEEK